MDYFNTLCEALAKPKTSKLINLKTLKIGEELLIEKTEHRMVATYNDPDEKENAFLTFTKNGTSFFLARQGETTC